MQRNKFQLGSSVYWIYAEDKNSKDKAKTTYRIYPDMLMVNRVSKDENGYHYSLLNGHDDAIDWCYEENVFSTLEDAEREVVKRNYTIMGA